MDLRLISSAMHPQVKIFDGFTISILKNYENIHSLNCDKKISKSSMAKLSEKLSNQNTPYKVMKA